jgi:hypothetical protein
MIIANLKEMSSHDFGVIYENKEHQWVNYQRNCGCIIAICIDIEPTPEELHFVSDNSLKRANLQTYMNNVSQLLSGEDMVNKINEFKNEILEIQKILQE